MGSQFGAQPLEFMTAVLTMNSTDNSTSLLETEAALLQNLERSTGIWQVRQGCAKVNPSNALAAAPWGISTFDPIDSDTMQYCVVANAKLYAGAAFALSDTSLVLTASTQMQLLPYQGVMLVNDPVKGLATYDGTTAGWAGCRSPQMILTLDTFEATTGWTGAGGVVSTVQTNVTKGRNNVKFKASAGGDWTVYKDITADLSAFPAVPLGDASASTVLDYIHIRFTRSYRSDFNHCTMDIYTKTDRTEKYSIELSDLQEWVNEAGSGVIFDLFIRKSAFTSTAGNWATVKGVQFTLHSATGCSPFLIIDFIELMKSGPIAREMAKTVADFEADETWASSAGTVTFSSIYKKTLSRSLVMDGSGAEASRTVTMNLTTFDHGVDAATIDSIEIALAKDAVKTGANLELRFYYDATHFHHCHFLASSIKTPIITAGLNKKLVDTSAVFTTLQTRLDQFTLGTGGTPSWATIGKVELLDSGVAGAWYVDSIKLVKTKDKKQVVSFEAGSTTETYSLSIDGTAKTVTWADPIKDFDTIRTDEGSTTSMVVAIPGGSVATIDITLSSDVDCTLFAGGGTVQDQDLIGPWIWFDGSSKHVANIDILYDVNDGNFTDYYIKSVPKEIIAAASGTQKNFWLKGRYQKNEHELFSGTSTGTWANVCKVRIQITTDASGGATVNLDQLNIERADVLSGAYWYRVRYRNSRGAISEYSQPSNRVEVKNASVLLTNVPFSTGFTREVERIGGQLTYWAKVGEIADDETTYFLDILSDDIPQAAIEASKTYGAPWISQAICILKDKVVLGNLTGPDGNKYKDAVMVGREYSVDEFDPSDIFHIGKDDGYSLLALIPWNDRVYAMKEKGIYSFDPYNLNQTPVQISHDFGIAGRFSYAVMDNGFVFLTPNKELYYYNGSTFENIGHIKTPPGGSVQSYLDAIPDSAVTPGLYINLTQGCYYKNFVLFSIVAAGGTTNSLVLAFYVPGRSWSVFSGWPVSSFHVTNYAGNAKLLSGWYDNYIYQLFSGNDDAGTEITGTFRSPDWGKDPSLLVQPATLMIAAAAISASPTILIEPWYNLADSTYDCPTGGITIAATFHRIQEGLRAAGTALTYLGLKLTFTKRSKVFFAALTRREESRR